MLVRSLRGRLLHKSVESPCPEKDKNMTIRELVESKLSTFTNVPKTHMGVISQEIASALGRVQAETRTLTAVAKKDGVYFGENTKTRLPGSPANRLYAAVCQLEAVCDKVTSRKGQYMVDIPDEDLPRIKVSAAWLDTYKDDIAKPEAAPVQS